MSGGPLRPAVFVDRDGTVIEDTGYPGDPDEVRLRAGAAAALRRFAAAGRLLIVVSNQSGVGRGLITPDEAAAVHERFVELLTDEGVRIDAAKYCPHAPDAGCECRKPSPRMLLEAAAELGIAMDESVMIGDKASDVEAGLRAGCRAILLIGHDSEADDAELVAGDWDQITDHLLGVEAGAGTTGLTH